MKNINGINRFEFFKETQKKMKYSARIQQWLVKLGVNKEQVGSGYDLPYITT